MKVSRIIVIIHLVFIHIQSFSHEYSHNLIVNFGHDISSFLVHLITYNHFSSAIIVPEIRSF